VIFLTLGNHHKTGLIGHHRHRNKNQLGIIKTGRIKRCGDGRCWRRIRQLQTTTHCQRINTFLTARQNHCLLASAVQRGGDSRPPTACTNHNSTSHNSAGHWRTPRPGGGLASGSSGHLGRGAKAKSSGPVKPLKRGPRNHRRIIGT
jgi:hypothetical protein